MKAQHVLVMTALAMHALAITLQFNPIQLVLVVIYAVLAVITWIARDPAGARVIWLFSGLGLIAYTILFAYTTIPQTGFEPLHFFVSVSSILAALVGVIANTLALELGAE